MKTLIPLVLLALCGAAYQEATEPETAPPSGRLEQHVWLDQLVGEWTVSSTAELVSGHEPVTWESRETVRSVGGLWVVAENVMGGPQPFTSLMTLGYDPLKGTFVGSWVDTMQTTMWTYVGHLDEAGRVLTLEAEGPSMHDARETAKYRDELELLAPDHRRMISSIQAEDGSWKTFMTVEAHRVE